MESRQRILYLTGIMVAVVVAVAAINLVGLYHTALAEGRERLREAAQSQARLIEAVARHERPRNSATLPTGAFESTMSQLREARENFEGFGRTGEFTLAQRIDDRIVFLLRHRHQSLDTPPPIPVEGELGEPMQRALAGQSGTLIGLDYRGERVLAAFEPVAVFGLGIVAKIDLEEIREPFLLAATLAGGGAVVLVLLGAVLMRRVGKPLVALAEESESKYRTLFESSAEGVFLFTDHFIDCNSQACILWACEREDIIGAHPLDFSPQRQQDGRESAEAIREHVEPALAGVPQVFEWQHLRKDGVLIDTEISLKAIEIADQRTLLAVMRDITERERQQREREQLEAQVQQAQKMESLGLLAGGIAHDFNNILTGVLGNASLALQQLPPESPVRESIQAIEKSSHRAAELSKQMLAYSGRGRFVVEPVDLSILVRETAPLVRSSVSKKANLVLDLTADLPAVKADATQLRQVVMNLITNASDALGEDEGRITIATRVMECDRELLDRARPETDLSEGRYVLLEVTDNGSGMDEATVEKIFDPFFTTKFTGRGLGLAATQGIVRGHLGAIAVESELGKGTTFRVCLPVSEEEVFTVAEREPLAAGRGTGTILVVDDEEAVRELARRICEHAGFEVVVAVDGLEAVAVFERRSDQIDIVLLDLTMPRLSGEETLRELRRIQPEVRVLLSSGFGEEEVTERLADNAPAAFVQKPYGADELLSAVLALLAP